MNATLVLWSWRTSVARGGHWKRERAVTKENAEAWKAVYRADEPYVFFLVANARPKRAPTNPRP